MSALRPVHARLTALRLRARLYFTIDGLTRLGFWGLALAAGFIGLDYLLRLPQGLRGANLAVWGLVLAVIFLRRLCYPLWRRLTRRDLALAVEARFPELDDRLISALQFEQRGAEGPVRPSTGSGRTAGAAAGGAGVPPTPALPPKGGGGSGGGAAPLSSPALMEAAIQDAARQAAALDFSRVLRTGARRTARLGLVCCLGGAAVLAVGHDDTLQLLTRRFFGAAVELPVAVELDLRFEGEGPRDFAAVAAPPVDGARWNFAVDRPARRVLLARESDLVVLAVPVRGAPDKATLVADAGGRERSERMEVRRGGGADAPARFRAQFAGVLNPFTFFVEAGDGRSADWTVEVRPAPRVESLRLTYRFPPYLKRADEVRTQRTIKAPVATRVAVELLANKPLRPGGARLRREHEDEWCVLEPLDDEGRPLAPERPARRFRTPADAPLEVTADERYHVALWDEDGLVNLHEEPGAVHAQQDADPQFVERRSVFGARFEHEAEYWTTPQGAIPLAVAATDDLGLEALRLFLHVGGDPAAVEVPAFTRVFAGTKDDPFPTDQLIAAPYAFTLRIADLRDKNGTPLVVGEEGDRARLPLRLVFEVEDNFEPFAPTADAGGHRARTDPAIRYLVVPRERLLSKLYDEVKKLKEQVETVYARLQDEAAGYVESARELFTEAGAATEPVREKLALARQKQDKVTKGAAGALARALTTVIRLYEYNDLEAGQPARPTTTRLRAVLRRLAVIAPPETDGPARGASEQAYRLLSEALSRETPAARVALVFEELPDPQDRCRAAWRAILDLLEEWEHFGEIEHLLRRLLERQEDLTDAYRGLRE